MPRPQTAAKPPCNIYLCVAIRCAFSITPLWRASQLASVGLFENERYERIDLRLSASDLSCAIDADFNGAADHGVELGVGQGDGLSRAGRRSLLGIVKHRRTFGEAVDTGEAVQLLFRIGDRHRRHGHGYS